MSLTIRLRRMRRVPNGMYDEVKELRLAISSSSILNHMDLLLIRYKLFGKNSTTLDFSLGPDMDRQTIIQCTYQNRWYGAFLQAYGKAVIPSIGWVGREHYDITFSGLEDGGIFMISTLGTRNQYGKDVFLEGYWELRRRFSNTKIICVGNYYPEMKGDVCLIPYSKSFGSSNTPYWQPSLVNWDMTLAIGGDA